MPSDESLGYFRASSRTLKRHCPGGANESSRGQASPRAPHPVWRHQGRAPWRGAKLRSETAPFLAPLRGQPRRSRRREEADGSISETGPPPHVGAQSSVLQSVRILAGCEEFGVRLCEPQHVRMRLVLRKLQRFLDSGECCRLTKPRSALVAAPTRGEQCGQMISPKSPKLIRAGTSRRLPCECGPGASRKCAGCRCGLFRS